MTVKKKSEGLLNRKEESEEVDDSEEESEGLLKQKGRERGSG